MYGELLNEVEAANFRAVRAEQEATRQWRFRHLKSKEQVVLTSVLTSILGLFLR
jgi:hypothetical protein